MDLQKVGLFDIIIFNHGILEFLSRLIKMKYFFSQSLRNLLARKKVLQLKTPKI